MTKDDYVCSCDESRLSEISYFNECRKNIMSRDSWRNSFTMGPVAFCPFCGKRIPELPDRYHAMLITQGRKVCPQCKEKLNADN